MAKKRKYEIDPVHVGELSSVDRDILTKTIDDGVYPLSMAKEIRLDRIRPDPNQPRTDTDSENLKRLATSIKEQGVLNPIGVQYVRQGNYFMIIHGERRWKASKMAGLETIPAIIKTVDAGERLIQQLVENIQREDLNPVDRGEALKRLRERLALSSWKTVGEKIGIGRVRVHQLLATTELPQEVQEDLRAGVISEKDTRAYTSLSSKDQLSLHQARKEKRLTEAQITRVARALKKHPHRKVEEVIQEVKAESEPLKRIPPRGTKTNAGLTVQSMIKFNHQLQKAIPGLALNELPESEQELFKDTLRTLHTLIEELLGQFEA